MTDDGLSLLCSRSHAPNQGIKDSQAPSLLFTCTLSPLLKQSKAKLFGWNIARKCLDGFNGYDSRLCMMQVLELYKGSATVEEVLDCACGDSHSAARASFACALYFEGRGDKATAFALLKAVVEVENAGDTYLHNLGRVHLSELRRGMLHKELSITAAGTAAAPAAGTSFMDSPPTTPTKSSPISNSSAELTSAVCYVPSSKPRVLFPGTLVKNSC